MTCVTAHDNFLRCLAGFPLCRAHGHFVGNKADELMSGSSTRHVCPYDRAILFERGQVETRHCIPEEPLLSGREIDGRAGFVHIGEVGWRA